MKAPEQKNGNQPEMQYRQIPVFAQSNCTKCGGTGARGTNATTKRIALCKCIHTGQPKNKDSIFLGGGSIKDAIENG